MSVVCNSYTRIIKNIFNKMKEDVGMLKPKKHVNKVGIYQDLFHTYMLNTCV